MMVVRTLQVLALSLFALFSCDTRGAVAQASGTDAVQQAEALREQGRDAEAVTVLRRAIADLEARSGLDNARGAALLNNLGELYYKLGRHAEAIPIYERALATASKSNTTANPLTAIIQRNLAIVYQLQGRRAEAKELYLASIAQLEKLMPATRVQLASSLNNLAVLYQETKRAKDAEAILQRVVKTYTDALPPGHPHISTALNNLSQFYQRAGDQTKAEMMMSAAVVNARKTLPADHPRLAPLLYNQGMLHVRSQQWALAIADLEQTVEIYAKQAQRSALTREGELSGLASGARAQQTAAIGAFVNSAMKLLTTDRSRGVELVGKILWAAQLTPSLASASLTQMSVRRLTGDGALTRLVRERQDLVADWQARSKADFERLAAGEGKKRRELAGEQAQLTKIDSRIVAIDRELAQKFPDYAALTNPQPLDVAQIQALLRDDEALVLFIETSSPSWVWVITKTDKALSLVDLGSEALAEHVAALRCGLDGLDWNDPSRWPVSNAIEVQRKAEQQKRWQRCKALYPQANANLVLPFSVKRAHSLYKSLFHGVEKAIVGKRLLVVPSKSLTQLPLGILVAEPSDVDVPRNPADYRRVDWLGARQAITVLPSVSSLAALRRNARPARATKPWIGFGNPLLDGALGNAQHAQRASAARAWQSCAQIQPRTELTPRGPAAIDDPMRGSLADVSVLRRQVPLPETASELCDVATLLSVPEADVWLGARATEQAIKDTSQRDELAAYATLHFATHGLVAGNFKGLVEPALLLTPPALASDDDDGLLTASEVAQLKLDANWIVLSACNTAAGGAEGAETLSGLARAFFYAGARSVLVSHWEVDSNAAVALTTRAFAALSKEPRIGRAEALRRAQLEVIADQRNILGAHPSHWAPFVLVGEGN